MAALPLGASSFVRSPTIHIIVGPDEDAHGFYVHQNLICARSKFFANATKGDWKEAQDKKITLSEDDPDIFELYLSLVYGYPLYFDKEGVRKGSWTESKAAKLYVLSEKLLDTEACQAATSCLKYLYTPDDPKRELVSPSLEAIRIIYDGTPEGDPLRKVLVSLYTTHRDKDYGVEFLTTSEVEPPSDFLQELAISMFNERPLKKQVTEQIAMKDRVIADLKASSRNRNLRRPDLRNYPRHSSSFFFDI